MHNRGGTMKHLCTGIAVLMAWAMAATVPLPAAVWNIDSDHTNAQFSVRHMMVSNVRGEFGKVT
ncbi:MAG: YceI family protein, partial [Acidobacteriota bacterium]